MGKSKQNLAMKCIKRFCKSPSKLNISHRSTVYYSEEQCDQKIYFYWPVHMHNYLQSLRLCQKISVSKLIQSAISAYLSKLIELIKRKAHRYFKALEHVLGAMHLAKSFQHRGIAGVRLVMIRGSSS